MVYWCNDSPGRFDFQRIQYLYTQILPFIFKTDLVLLILVPYMTITKLRTYETVNGPFKNMSKNASFNVSQILALQ